VRTTTTTTTTTTMMTTTKEDDDAGDNNNNDEDRSEDNVAVECHSGTCVSDGCCKSTQKILSRPIFWLRHPPQLQTIIKILTVSRQVLCWL